MIIILTGPTGSGKTDASLEFLKIFNNMVFLDCDWFAAMQPFSWDKKSDVIMVYQAMAQMIAFYLKTGKTRFVVTMTSQMALLFSELSTILNPNNLPVRAFRLRCTDDQLLARIDLRNRVSKKQEEIIATRQQKLFDTAFSTNIPFMKVDVSNLNQQEVVRKIRTMINEYEKLQKLS
ncbi:MAG: AAA family ATPase [Candidatus Dependentiae bacterium]|nr:AAA family ATPase [Candidatus Dependentiae bacterium]